MTSRPTSRRRAVCTGDSPYHKLECGHEVVTGSAEDCGSNCQNKKGIKPPFICAGCIFFKSFNAVVEAQREFYNGNKHDKTPIPLSEKGIDACLYQYRKEEEMEWLLSDGRTSELVLTTAAGDEEDLKRAFFCILTGQRQPVTGTRVREKLSAEKRNIFQVVNEVTLKDGEITDTLMKNG